MIKERIKQLITKLDNQADDLREYRRDMQNGLTNEG